MHQRSAGGAAVRAHEAQLRPVQHLQQRLALGWQQRVAEHDGGAAGLGLEQPQDAGGR